LLSVLALVQNPRLWERSDLSCILQAKGLLSPVPNCYEIQSTAQANRHTKERETAPCTLTDSRTYKKSRRLREKRRTHVQSRGCRASHHVSGSLGPARSLTGFLFFQAGSHKATFWGHVFSHPQHTEKALRNHPQPVFHCTSHFDAQPLIYQRHNFPTALGAECFPRRTPGEICSESMSLLSDN